MTNDELLRSVTPEEFAAFLELVADIDLDAVLEEEIS